MVGFQDLIQTLYNLGVGDVLLPFLLIFTIVFAVMQKSEPFGKGNKKIHVVIALILGLVVVIPHIIGLYPTPESDVVNIINHALPNVAVLLVAILMVLLLAGMFGQSASSWTGSIKGWIAVLSFAVVAFIFARAAGWLETLPAWLYWLDDPTTQAILLVAAVFGIIIWFIVKDDEAEKPSFSDSLQNVFFGGGKGGAKKD
jgi:hypothetical protein